LEQLSSAASGWSWKLRQAHPRDHKGLRHLERGRRQDQSSGKFRELIALAVAVSLRCDGCIAVHTESARKLGATKAEIAEALSVAMYGSRDHSPADYRRDFDSDSTVKQQRRHEPAISRG
jgi:AhpD family alkylhydroperoxidase